MQKVAISLTPHLSLYELVNVANVNNIFTERRDILARWCESLERKVIENRWPVDVFAGFQELDNLAPVFTRYQQIAQVAHSVWVFGRPATLALRDSNIHAVELMPDARLVKEWFLIVKGSECRRALVAQEISQPGTPVKRRIFNGTYVSDAEAVDALYYRLLEAIRERANQP